MNYIKTNLCKRSGATQNGLVTWQAVALRKWRHMATAALRTGGGDSQQSFWEHVAIGQNPSVSTVVFTLHNSNDIWEHIIVATDLCTRLDANGASHGVALDSSTTTSNTKRHGMTSHGVALPTLCNSRPKEQHKREHND
jgi:hypothetical protein